MQTRVESFVETVINVILGFFIAFFSQLLIFPWFGINIPVTTNLKLGLIFTVISIIRMYAVRRWFNGRLKSAAHIIAKRFEHAH